MPPDGGEGDGVMPSKGGPCEKLSFPDPEPADDVERKEPSSKKLPRRMLGYDALTGDAEGDGSGFVDVDNVLIARSFRRRWLPPSFLARDLAKRRPQLCQEEKKRHEPTDDPDESVMKECVRVA